MTKGDIAEKFFMQGYNCSQSVALAFSEEMSLDAELVARMLSGFGGGIGRMREVCGCVSGMVFVIDNLYGYSDPKDYEAKKLLYGRVNYAAEKYREINGSIICRELLGIKEKDGIVPEKRTDKYYKKRPCSRLCKIAGDILAEYIAEHQLPRKM